MSDQETTKNVWPDQWFVSDGLNIEGPLTAKEAFATVDKVSDIFKSIEKPKIGSELLVSRKGFTKWYKYSELHNLYLHGRTDNQSIVANLRDDIIHEIDRMKTLLPTEPSVEVKQASSALFNITHPLENRLGSPVHAKPAPQSFEPEGDFSPASRNLFSEPAESLIHEDSLYNQEASPAAPKAQEEGASRRPRQDEDLSGKSLDYLHIMYRGRLRLGTLSSPFSTAASTLVLFNIPEWVSKFYQEILWHLDDAHFKKKNVTPWLSMLPLINWLVFYRLATAMMAVEIQNNYRSVSIFKVLVAALFPPLGVYYLERAAQKHWITHLTHIQQVHNQKSNKT